MKTIEEFINEINGSEALQNELEAVKDKIALEAFLKKNDCGFTAEEFVKALKAEGAISDDEVEAAAGGINLIDFADEIRRFYPIRRRESD